MWHSRSIKVKVFRHVDEIFITFGLLFLFMCVFIYSVNLETAQRLTFIPLPVLLKAVGLVFRAANTCRRLMSLSLVHKIEKQQSDKTVARLPRDLFHSAASRSKCCMLDCHLLSAALLPSQLFPCISPWHTRRLWCNNLSLAEWPQWRDITQHKHVRNILPLNI